MTNERLRQIEEAALEFQQRAEGGGFPLPNENGIEHGTLLMVSRKADWLEVLDEVYELRKTIRDIGRRAAEVLQ